MHGKLCSLRILLACLVVALTAVPSRGEEVSDSTAPTATPAATPAPDPSAELGSGPLAGPRWGRPPLTGDWLGSRRWLAERGLTLGIDVVNITQSIVDGGTDGDTENNGSVYMEMHFDSQKAGLWPGGFLDFRVEKSYGETINAKTATVLGANMVGLFPDQDDKTVVVSKLLLAQFLTEWAGVLLGRFDSADGEGNHFASGRGRTQFFNPRLTFSPQAAVTTPYVLNGGGGLFLIPSLAPGHPGTLNLMVADPQVAPDESGFDDDFFDEWWVGGELHVPTRFFDLPGSQNFAFTYNTIERLTLGSLRDLILPGQEPDRTKTWTVSYNFHQYFHVRDSQDSPALGYDANTPQLEGSGVFGRFAASDDDLGINNLYFALGLGGRGLGGWRRSDTYGAAGFLTWGGDADKLPILDLKDETWGVELFYNAEILPSIHVTPDLQFLGPLLDVDTAVVLGLRVKVDL